MPTTNTYKNSLALAIGAVAMPALMASLGRVACVNRLDLDTLFTRNVREFQEERRERPSVVDQSLLFSDLDPRSNAFEVFDCYRPGANFQSFVHDPVRDIPEQPLNRSLLFARQPLQEPSLISALVPCGLKIAALFESALSNVLDNSALENLACAGCGDADDTRIYADARVTIRVGNIFCNDQMQIPDSTFMGDCSCRLVPPRPAEILPVVVGEDQVKLDSAAESSQRGVFLIEFDCQRSSVVPHRRGIFPPVMFVFISLVRFRNHVASRANEVGRKLRHFPYASIGDVVKRHRAKDVLLEGNVRGVVERHCVCFLSLGERLRNLLSYLKLYLQRDSYSHVGNIYHLTYRYCNRVLRYAKPTRNADFLRPATSRQSPSAKLMNRRKIQCSD
jgi:hypothetical protein